MTKIAVSTKGIDVSGSVRGVKGKVALRPDAVSLDINIGIGSVGVTSDYGGAGKVSIARQSVTWGLEGGKIELGVGGFEVNVEARDCVVTETKKIFGQVVATRTYPDPGCNPKPEEAKGSPQPPPLDPETGIELEDGLENVYVVLQAQIQGSEIDTSGTPPSIDTWYSNHKVSVSNISDTVEEYSYYKPLPFTVEEAFEWGRTVSNWQGTKSSRGTANGKTTALTRLTSHSRQYVILSGDCRPIIETSYIYLVNGVKTAYDPFFASPTAPAMILYGTRTNCNRLKREVEELNSTNYSDTGYNKTNKLKYSIQQVITLGKQKPPARQLPTGNRPLMDNCCKEILADLEDIKEALAVDRILKDKFPVSNSFMAPGVDPNSKTEAKDYYEITQCLFRMMAHGMIFEPKAVIKDASSAKAGDQSLEVRYVNATGWAKAMSSAILEIKDDGNVSTNMDLRNGFTVTQSLVALVDVVNKLDAILDVLGVTLKPKTEKVTTAFNCMIQTGKGFGENNEKQLDLNEDKSTEALIPEFLKTRENTIKTVEIHPRSESLYEMLRQIQKSLPRQE